MNEEKPNILPFGDHAVRAVWPAKINQQTNTSIVTFLRKAKEVLGDSILDFTISYNELAFYLFDGEQLNTVIEKLNSIELPKAFTESTPGQKIYIPVCYEDKYALDMKALSEAKGISREKIIKLHTEPSYLTYFIGFLPGFPYLGGLNSEIAHPRKSKPRKKVSKGAVGIAANQTGIYPTSSPGGWNIIGQSPIPLFNPQDQTATLLKAGDQVVFYEIDSSTLEIFSEELEQYSIRELREMNQKLYSEHHD